MLANRRMLLQQFQAALLTDDRLCPAVSAPHETERGQKRGVSDKDGLGG